MEPVLRCLQGWLSVMTLFGLFIFFYALLCACHGSQMQRSMEGDLVRGLV